MVQISGTERARLQWRGIVFRVVLDRERSKGMTWGHYSIFPRLETGKKRLLWVLSREGVASSGSSNGTGGLVFQLYLNVTVGGPVLGPLIRG